MSRPGSRLAGRAVWNVADQVVSSGTNLVLSVLIARTLSADGFGAFAVAFAVYAFLIGAGRSLFAQALSVRYVGRGEIVFRAAARASTGAAVLLGVVCGALTLIVGVVVGGVTGTSLAVMGVLMPALLLQDMWRAVFIAEGRPRAAFVNDAIWAVAQFAAVGALIALGRAEAPLFIAAWGVSALIAAICGGFQFRGHPQVWRSVRWLQDQRDIIGYYGASFLSVLGANQITLFLLAAISSPAVVGALRAAQVVLGPLNLAATSMTTFAIPEIARRGLSGVRALRAAALVSAGMVLADLAWGAVLLLLPSGAGEQLLGDSWRNAQAVLPASILGVAAIGAGLGAAVLLVGRGYVKETFIINAVSAPCFLVFGVGGLLLGGAMGAALGLSLVQVVVAPLAWWRATVLMRRETDRTEAATLTGPAG